MDFEPNDHDVVKLIRNQLQSMHSRELAWQGVPLQWRTAQLSLGYEMKKLEPIEICPVIVHGEIYYTGCIKDKQNKEFCILGKMSNDNGQLYTIAVATPGGIVFDGRNKIYSSNPKSKYSNVTFSKFLAANFGAISHFQEIWKEDFLIVYPNTPPHRPKYSGEEQLPLLVLQDDCNFSFDRQKVRPEIQDDSFDRLEEYPFQNDQCFQKVIVSRHEDVFEVYLDDAMNSFARKMDKPHIFWKLDLIKHGKKKLNLFQHIKEKQKEAFMPK
eukprot:GHVP01058434.1.p1 GENE.GHVP01058434.1~~GHVP01058434.1.p1  ORF type:complete len:270 (-),score=49.00 GHVP01058434.1:171-980(-)